MYDKFLRFVTNIAKLRGWKLDEQTTEMIVFGLIAQYKKHGKPYCPCEFILREDLSKVCPCDAAEEDIKSKGHCKCKLFKVSEMD